MARGGDSKVRAAAIDLFGGRRRPWSWGMPTAALVLAGLGVFMVTLGQDLDSGWDWVWVVAGVAVGVVSGAMQLLIQWADRQLDRVEGTAAERLRVAMKDALQPLAQGIAQMPAKTPGQRRADRKAVAQQAVGALTLLLKDVERLRAVVYAIDDAVVDAPLTMSAIAYLGRGTTPRSFVSGTARGDSALELVATAGDVFVENLAKQQPAEYGGSGSDYATFISASITTGEAGGSGFGMVTVDAPTAGDLVDTDRQIVMVVANMLAAAFAIAESA